MKLIHLSILLLSCFFTMPAPAQGWQWGRAGLGGQMDGWATATDPSGNVFIAGVNLTGYATGIDQATVFGTYSVTFTGFSGNQCVVAKYDASGNALWAIGTQNGESWLMGITTDHAGNLFLFGTINSPSLQIGSFTLTNTIYSSVPLYHGIQYFLAKIDPSGNVVWAKNAGSATGYATALLGGLAITDCGTGAVATDTAGNIYVTANFYIPTITIGTYTLTNTTSTGYNDDILLAKYDPDGNVVWATSAGGTGSDDAYGMTVTPAGDIYISGIFTSPSITFGPSTIIDSAGVYQSAFIARYNSSGTPVWACSSGGHGGIFAVGLASDAANNVYLTGSIGDTTIYFNGTKITDARPESLSLYILKFDPANSVSWYKVISATAYGQAWGYSVATSPCGNIWVSGSFTIDANIDGHILTAPANSYFPVLIAGFDAAGAYIGSAAIQDGGDDQSGVACDAAGNVYLCSDYECSGFAIAGSTFPGMWANGDSEYIYVAKYAPLAATPPDTIFTHQDTAICSLSGILLNAPAGYNSYLWNNGSTGTSISIDSLGIYWVAGYNPCANIVVIDTFTVAKKNVDLSFSLGPDTIVCNPVTLTVPLTGVSYLWQNGSTGSSYTAMQSGTYYVTVSKDGCSNSDTISINVYNVSQDLRDTTLCRETFSQYVLSANVPPHGNVLWSTGSTQPSITVNDTGRYWVTVMDAACSGSDTMLLKTQLCHCEAVLPTAFTPNGDGKNDYYYPIFETGCPIADYAFSIFNRWGQRVFYSEDVSAKWDGIFEGVMAEVGVYMYYLKYNSGFNNIPHTAKGDVTLIR